VRNVPKNSPDVGPTELTVESRWIFIFGSLLAFEFKIFGRRGLTFSIG
jgi:hypothetical protein